MKASYLLAISLLLTSCASQQDTLMFQINDTFAVYKTPDCSCLTFQHRLNGQKGEILQKHVIAVLGNPDAFLVQTSPANAPSTLWSFVDAQHYSNASDIIKFQPEQIDSVLERLKIQFMKDYSGWEYAD